MHFQAQLLTETEFSIGDLVEKKSKRKFKSGNEREFVTGIGVNETDPKKRPCVVFADGSVCNFDKLAKIKQ